MKRLTACAVVLLCACAGTGVGIAAVFAPSGIANPAAAYTGPIGHGGAVMAVADLVPGPANPGGPYGYVTIPCHPWSCAAG